MADYGVASAYLLLINDVLKDHIEIHGPGGAAELLGVNPGTLRYRLKKLGSSTVESGLRAPKMANSCDSIRGI